MGYYHQNKITKSKNTKFFICFFLVLAFYRQYYLLLLSWFSVHTAIIPFPQAQTVLTSSVTFWRGVGKSSFVFLGFLLNSFFSFLLFLFFFLFFLPLPNRCRCPSGRRTCLRKESFAFHPSTKPKPRTNFPTLWLYVQRPKASNRSLALQYCFRPFVVLPKRVFLPV